MHPSNHLAARLLRFEQQLQAYQKLHGEELVELWKSFNECKREFTAALPDDGPNGSDPARLNSAADEKQEESENDT